MGDVERALAFVARRQGNRSLPTSTWRHVLSLELGWMPPGQAAGLVERATAAGILVADNDNLRLAVDPATVAITPGFRPDPNAAADKRVENPFVNWADKIAAHARIDRAEVLARVQSAQDNFGGWLTGDAAILLVASDAGLDVTSAARAALKAIAPTAPAPTVPP